MSIKLGSVLIGIVVQPLVMRNQAILQLLKHTEAQTIKDLVAIVAVQLLASTGRFGGQSADPWQSWLCGVMGPRPFDLLLQGSSSKFLKNNNKVSFSVCPPPLS